jgi:hypothetical protein
VSIELPSGRIKREKWRLGAHSGSGIVPSIDAWRKRATGMARGLRNRLSPAILSPNRALRRRQPLRMDWVVDVSKTRDRMMREAQAIGSHHDSKGFA